MIPIKRLHYKLDMKLNKLASNEHQQISQEDKDFALNEAQLKLIKKKVGLNNAYGMGFDSFRKRYQDLEFLVVPHEQCIPVKTKEPLSVYQVDLEKLKNKFFLPVDIYTEATLDNCKGRTVWIEQIIKHSDVRLKLSSTSDKPSFAYQLTFAEISSGMLRIYSEEQPKPFVIDKAFVSYLRYPVRVSFGGYEDFDGETEKETDCEFPEFLEDELLEIAVQDLALITENQLAAQAAQIRAKDSE